MTCLDTPSCDQWKVVITASGWIVPAWGTSAPACREPILRVQVGLLKQPVHRLERIANLCCEIGFDTLCVLELSENVASHT